MNFLSDSDVAILKVMVSKEKGKLQNTGGRGEKNWNPEEDQGAPEVYIALPPSTGIPALDFTGTASGPGEGDIPGYADCRIFQLIHNYPDPPSLIPMGIALQRVYNITQEEIVGQGGNWITVIRLKDGAWIAQASLYRIRHVIINECLGEGWYLGRFANYDLLSYPLTTDDCTPCDDTGTGTATSTGVLLGCDSVRTELGYHLDGEAIYIYDPRNLRLIVGAGSHAIVIDMGDRMTDYSTGTGTVESGPLVGGGEIVWHVLTGAYTKVTISDRIYACCDTVVTVVSQINYCVEGSSCEVLTSCGSVGTAPP